MKVEVVMKYLAEKLGVAQSRSRSHQVCITRDEERTMGFVGWPSVGAGSESGEQGHAASGAAASWARFLAR